jgi:hypothetical protein
MSDESLERAVQRTTLASRCLDGAAASAPGGDFGVAAVVAADFLAGECPRLQTFVDALTRLTVNATRADSDMSGESDA